MESRDATMRPDASHASRAGQLARTQGESRDASKCVNEICASRHKSSMLLAIDPGTDTGWSLFCLDGRLYACGLGDPRETVRRDLLCAVTRIIVEKPRINPGGRARPNDMITLAVKAGRWCGLFEAAEATLVEPWAWKGNLSKDECAARVRARLFPTELAAVDAAIAAGGAKGRPMAMGKVHNMLDAIGIGLHGVGRGLRSQAVSS